MTSVVEARTGRVLAWKDGIPLRYEYTVGVAGEAFLRGLKDGRILASKCTMCGEVRIPPRTYCLECGARTRIDVELLHLGRISALSTSARKAFGFVAFAGVSGGIVHRLLYEGRLQPRMGDPVAPVFAPPGRRAGSILDLVGFRTAARRKRRND